ncbi:hypothetical protein SAMN04488490_1807 [Marinobacter sp. LV10R510-11A]|nr:hypothetical protein SAMN04488490_1807 [Marinobacter sp. LV10R510-11A]
MEACKSYRRGTAFCADGFPQCAYCWNGRTGVYNRPLCLNDDPSEHQMKAFLDDAGMPKKIAGGCDA